MRNPFRRSTAADGSRIPRKDRTERAMGDDGRPANAIPGNQAGGASGG